MRRKIFKLTFMCIFCLTILQPVIIKAQLQPVYDSSKGFFDYQKKMNAYYHNVGKIKGYKQWKRMEWYFEPRVKRNGKMVNIQKMNQQAIQKVVSARANLSGVPAETNMVSGNWTNTGPSTVIQSNNGIGRVNRFAFHPTNANIFWAATAGGGLWKTTNAGGSWVSLTDGLPNLNLQGVAVNPANTNIIYILTGDADGNNGGAEGCCSFGKNSTGVLKSTDGGVSWAYTGLKWDETEGKRPFKLIIHPSNPNILFVAGGGLWRTDNAGSTWTQSMAFEKIYDMEFMPNNSLIAYFSTNDGKFFRSTDGGTNWTLQFSSPNPQARRTSIAVTPDNSSVVYMLISNDRNPNNLDSSYTFNGLYYSGNTGLSGSWVKRASRLPNVFSGDGTGLIGGQQNYDHALAVSPFNDNQVITGGVSFFVSSNGGSTLNYVDNDIANYHVDIHELAYSPASTTLYAATDGGVYKSNDFGVTWASANTNLGITQYYRISTSAANSAYVLGGAQDNGSHLRVLSSSVFEMIKGKDGMDNAIGQSNPNIMYVSAQGGDFYKSYNGGNTVSLFCDSTILAAFNINIQYFWVNNIVLHPANDNIAFIGYQPVVRAIDIGGTVTFSSIGALPGTDVSGKTVLNISRSNPNVIYAGDNSWGSGEEQRLWRTTNGGSSWTSLTIPYQNALFTRLTINPDDEDEIWLTYGGYEDGNKVFRSLNGGSSWTNISGSLPNVPVNCIIYDDNNGSPNDALYIGTDIGVFYRDNSLGDWIPFNNGLPVVEISDLELQESAGILRAGTFGRGVWQTAVYDGACATNLSFTTHPPSSPGFYVAGNIITSSATISGAGSTVQYKAGQHITLTPGFRVNSLTDAKFIGYIGPCTEGGIPPGFKQPAFNGLPGFLKDQ
jgi:photosystem II stability/assembly factor-like uncharacterized protein